jgi:prevent-host-death family protein
MKSVNIAELKNQLSYYLNEVKAGEEIVIRERNKPVARLMPLPLAENDYEHEMLELAAQGKIKLAEIPVDEDFVNQLLSLRLPRIKGKTAQQIIDEERNED